MRTSRLAALASGALLLTLGACKSDKQAGDALAQDSTLTHDLQLANHDTVSQPQLQDIATTTPPAAPAASQPQPAAPSPAPRRTTPVRSTSRTPAPVPERRRVVQAPPPVVQAPAPTPVTTPSGNTVQQRRGTGYGNSEGSIGVVAAGTSLALSAGQRVCTNSNTVGDRFTASLAEAVTASNGVVIPAGATAVLQVTSLQASKQAGQNMGIGLAVQTISYGGKSYPVDGQVVSAQTERVASADNSSTGKVVGGAILGGILGNIFGGRSKAKGTIIGAAGGAAAGAVLAHQTQKYDACIPAGGRIAVRLNAPMSVQATTASSAM